MPDRNINIYRPIDTGVAPLPISQPPANTAMSQGLINAGQMIESFASSAFKKEVSESDLRVQQGLYATGEEYVHRIGIDLVGSNDPVAIGKAFSEGGLSIEEELRKNGADETTVRRVRRLVAGSTLKRLEKVREEKGKDPSRDTVAMAGIRNLATAGRIKSIRDLGADLTYTQLEQQVYALRDAQIEDIRGGRGAATEFGKGDAALVAQVMVDWEKDLEEELQDRFPEEEEEEVVEPKRDTLRQGMFVTLAETDIANLKAEAVEKPYSGPDEARITIEGSRDILKKRVKDAGADTYALAEIDLLYANLLTPHIQTAVQEETALALINFESATTTAIDGIYKSAAELPKGRYQAYRESVEEWFEGARAGPEREGDLAVLEVLDRQKEDALGRGASLAEADERSRKQEVEVAKGAFKEDNLARIKDIGADLVSADPAVSESAQTALVTRIALAQNVLLLAGANAVEVDDYARALRRQAALAGIDALALRHEEDGTYGDLLEDVLFRTADPLTTQLMNLAEEDVVPRMNKAVDAVRDETDYQEQKLEAANERIREEKFGGYFAQAVMGELSMGELQKALLEANPLTSTEFGIVRAVLEGQEGFRNDFVMRTLLMDIYMDDDSSIADLQATVANAFNSLTHEDMAQLLSLISSTREYRRSLVDADQDRNFKHYRSLLNTATGGENWLEIYGVEGAKLKADAMEMYFTLSTSGMEPVDAYDRAVESHLNAITLSIHTLEGQMDSAHFVRLDSGLLDYDQSIANVYVQPMDPHVKSYLIDRLVRHQGLWDELTPEAQQSIMSGNRNLFEAAKQKAQQ